AGLKRVAWPLTRDPAPDDSAGRGGRGGRGGAAGGRGGGGAQAGGANPETSGEPQLQPCSGGTGGGRGGRGGGAGGRVPEGVYVATLGKMVGTTVTPIGPSQTFQVLPLPR
ncbi:MAG TPA: hypothetical protein VF178_09755, partial [Gemmatimonadaceae bacterium]